MIRHEAEPPLVTDMLAGHLLGYARSRSWQEVPGNFGPMRVFRHPEFGPAQVIVPDDPATADGQQSIRMSVRALAKVEGVEPEEMLRRLRDFGLDRLLVHFPAVRNPFELGTDLVEYLGSACEAVLPPERTTFQQACDYEVTTAPRRLLQVVVPLDGWEERASPTTSSAADLARLGRRVLRQVAEVVDALSRSAVGTTPEERIEFVDRFGIEFLWSTVRFLDKYEHDGTNLVWEFHWTVAEPMPGDRELTGPYQIQPIALAALRELLTASVA